MGVRLKQAYERNQNIKFSEGDAILKDDNAIHDAIKLKVIKDIKEGDFESIENLRMATGAFIERDSSPVKIGVITMVVFKDTKGGVHEVTSKDPLAEVMVKDKEYTHVKTYSIDDMR